MQQRHLQYLIDMNSSMRHESRSRVNIIIPQCEQFRCKEEYNEAQSREITPNNWRWIWLYIWQLHVTTMVFSSQSTTAKNIE